MAEDPKRPTLRIVSPDETPAVAPPESTRTTAKLILPPPDECNALASSIDNLDAQVPISAAYLACVGCRLASSALDFYHQAVAHALPGTFRRDTPPGLKSAEATRTWLQTHLDAVKQMAEARRRGEIRPSYDRGRDLKEAVALAGRELDRAAAATRAAGLWFEERREGLFRDAQEDLATVITFLQRHSDAPAAAAVSLAPVHETLTDLYVFGADVLANYRSPRGG